jgi:hypothetical protein
MTAIRLPNGMLWVVDHESVVIVLSAGGAWLERDALDAVDGTAVTWARLEREGAAACLAARVRHADPPEHFRDRIRLWAAARGWAVTVAPGRRSH